MDICLKSAANLPRKVPAGTGDAGLVDTSRGCFLPSVAYPTMLYVPDSPDSGYDIHTTAGGGGAAVVGSGTAAALLAVAAAAQ